ncbi:sarcosine oxidase subunit gamma [Yoonia sp. 2307UL14-13]|uniref:sarcosine oxidase subunit gamma n=1 Tax=Yoonia sp. 2307UL14-13 TaxID=3126506 RepID=UPI0030959D1A
MVKLLPLSPSANLLPREVGGIALEEVVLDRILSVAPFRGQAKATSAALKNQIGLGLSAVGRATSNRRARVLWAGHRIWLVTAEVTLDGFAAVSDQSDAWAITRASGAGVEDMLARLVPMDLRPSAFRNGHTARTMLRHMSVSITRVGAQAFEIMAMRSMAGTLVHELESAARGVAARR